jgi:hypothetical protein
MTTVPGQQEIEYPPALWGVVRAAQMWHQAVTDGLAEADSDEGKRLLAAVDALHEGVTGHCMNCFQKLPRTDLRIATINGQLMDARVLECKDGLACDVRAGDA